VSGLTCAELEALAPELALGVLSGNERGAALVHLAGCEACRARLAELARAADLLLLAAPEVEPPLGFESRVLEALDAARRPVAPRRWRRWTVAAAAAAAIVLATVGGVAAGRASTPSAQGAVRTTVVSFGGGRWSCRVAAFPGHGGRATELVVHLDEPEERSSSYTVEAEPVGGGPPVAIGTIALQGGTGVLDTTIPPGTGKVQGVLVRETNGTLRYRASFAPA
jgi:hypothetical protein